MKNNVSDKIPTTENRNRDGGEFIGILRVVALIAAAVGAVGSFGLTIDAGRSSPRILMILFVIWVLAPFVALAWANLVSKGWAVPTRATLYCVTLIITLSSLAIYGKIILPPAGSPSAFVFVVVPPGSWLLSVIAVLAAVWISRRRSRRDAGD